MLYPMHHDGNLTQGSLGLGDRLFVLKVIVNLQLFSAIGKSTFIENK